MVYSKLFVSLTEIFCFIIRFLLLRKRPSGLKIIAAAAVLIAEFIALIPSIFPSLQSTKTKEEEGGASGVAGVLWPLCYALGYVCIF